MWSSRFFDPLYGTVQFNNWEAALIFSPEVQRLRYVRMCNINSLLISGASEISRFEHVIGVLHLAREWTKANGITGEDAEVVHAAALLHDVQTGPFGHSLEYILNDNEVEGEFSHEDVLSASEKLFLQTIRRNAAFSGAQFAAAGHLGSPLWERVTEAIRGGGRFGRIIAGRIDLDNIDNVVRLGYHAGVADRHDAEICTGLANDLRLENDDISISLQGAEFLERWACIRRDLYHFLLHDWAEFSAKAMLTTMMELGVEAGILGADSWLMTDDAVIAWLIRESVGEAQIIGEIGRRLTLGDLYTPLVLWRSPSISSYNIVSRIEFKREMERALAGILKTRCILHVIHDNGKTERKLSVRVREHGEMREFGQDSCEILIGAFLSRADQSVLAEKRAVAELRRRLIEVGVEGITDLADPVAAGVRSAMANPQLPLL